MSRPAARAKREDRGELPRIGCHVSAEGGPGNAAARAAKLRCETVQLFSRSPRMWRCPPLAQESIDEFRSLRARHDIRPAVIHTIYLVNLASPDADLRDRSIEAVAEDLRRAAVLGCEYVVTHLGSAGSLTPSAARRRAVSAVNRIIASAPKGPVLLLENSAGQGRILGSTFEELCRIIMESRYPERLGLTVDSAHAFAQGSDVRTTEGIDAMLEPIAATVGVERVRVVHLNDSMAELGSGRDRHEHIGEGWIGRSGIKAWLAHPVLRLLPMILETPIHSDGDDVRNLRRVRRLAREAAAR